MTETDAYRAGESRGHDLGSWIIDGNTTVATAEHIVDGIENGNPEVMDMQPAPLSGEWAGESITELSDLYDIDLEDDETATEFEEGFSDGFWQEVESAARFILDGMEPFIVALQLYKREEEG